MLAKWKWLLGGLRWFAEDANRATPLAPASAPASAPVSIPGSAPEDYHVDLEDVIGGPNVKGEADEFHAARYLQS